MKEKQIMVSGKRKTAIAKALIKAGSGVVRVNKKPHHHLPYFEKLMIQEPIEIAKEVLGNFNFDIKVEVKGGGQKSQIEAARLAIARGLIKFTKSGELKKKFHAYDKNILVADTRRKETYKPGDSKARRKRQKSYR